MLSSEPILYFLFYCCTFFFLLYLALVSLKGFFLGTFTLLLQLLSRKISAILFLETCLAFFLFFFFFFHCNFLFQKFQCCFSYCSNFLFSKLSFNVTLLFLDIFSLIKCRFLCKIKFLWTWLKNWSLNRNLHYSSNTIMHTRKNTLNIFACRAFSRYISYIRNFCINIRLFNYYYHKKKEKIPLQISHIYQCFLEYYKKKTLCFPFLIPIPRISPSLKRSL